MTLPAASAASLALALALAPACASQRHPPPMGNLVSPLPPGAIPPPPYGPQEILVYRYSDPVLVRRAGEAGSYPLPSWQKLERLRSGASVICAAGGRCEILWPQDASAIVLFDDGFVDLGEPSRDEPMLTFRTVTRARLDLTPEDRVVLMGGAVLRGDPMEKSGPFLVDRTRTDVIEISNQSKRACTIAFREEEILLSPGEKIALPLLEAGGAPIVRDPSESVVTLQGREVRVVGRLEPDGDGLSAVGGEAELRDGGVRVRLAPGDRVVLDAFSAPSATLEPAALEPPEREAAPPAPEASAEGAAPPPDAPPAGGDAPPVEDPEPPSEPPAGEPPASDGTDPR